MQEQPPSDPPRREPATGARRSRSPKPTFTPPATPQASAPPARQPDEGDTGQARPRRAKGAPTVLFQPPDPAQALARSTPAEPSAPRPRPAAADTTTAPFVGIDGDTTAAGSGPTTADTRPATASRQTSEPAEQVDPPETGQESRKRARKITAKKAAPAARQRTGTSPSRTGSSPGDEHHDRASASVAGAQPGAAEPASPSEPGTPEGVTSTSTGIAEGAAPTQAAGTVGVVPSEQDEAEAARRARAGTAVPATSTQVGSAEPTGPVSSAAAAMVEPAAGPGEGPKGTAGQTRPAKKAAAPRKSSTRSATPKKATAAKKAARATTAATAATQKGPADTTPAAPDPVAPAPMAAGTAEPVTPSAATPAVAAHQPPRQSRTEADQPATTSPATPAAGAPARESEVDGPTARSQAEADQPATASPATPTRDIDEPVREGRAEADEAVREGPTEADEPVRESRTAAHEPVTITVSAGQQLLTGELEPAASRRTAGAGWRAISSRILDHPGFAPELLALAAVEALGPRARDWAERVRDAYPDADADGLARLVSRRFVRLAGASGATAAMAGLFAPVAELAAVLWTQANLVLHLAAVYGRDPSHPDRAAELLVLTQVHPDTDSARAALDAARAADGPGEQPWPRAAEAVWRLAAPLAAQAGGWLGLRLASRLLPGAAVLAAATGDAAATERLAARAITVYRPARLG